VCVDKKVEGSGRGNGAGAKVGKTAASKKPKNQLGHGLLHRLVANLLQHARLREFDEGTHGNIEAWQIVKIATI